MIVIGARRLRGSVVAAWFAIVRAFAVTVLQATSAAAEPVKRIAIYVEPFYRAADAPDEAPRVGTGKPFEALLASTRKEDILKARDAIVASPRFVSPMTLMVLAIRLYDFGLRDDSVMWFYAAKDRYLTLAESIVADHPLLSQSRHAIGAFVTLAGPTINGYAFCDVANQQAQRAKALAWVEANPYGSVYLEKLPARMPDRDAALKKAVAKMKEYAAKEALYLSDPGNVAKLKATRTQNGADERFCWSQ